MESLKAFNEGYRVIVNQGGTRSGKTFSLTQLLIALAYKSKYSISICSVSFPHLRKGAMRDWRKIMEDYGLYESSAHMKTEQLYTYPSGSYIEFFSVDNALKVRGPGREILFINESNIINYDTFRQLLLRTTKCIFIDYNPADEFHWIYDKVLTRPDCYFIKSTYKDNPFLEKDQIREIENYKETDENFWRIYGQGERGHSEGIIYTNWDTFTVAPNGYVCYGLDFGMHNPTALVKITEKDKEIYAEELFYRSNVVNHELIPILKQLLPPNAVVYGDHEDSNRMQEIRMAGINALNANKDVKAGIQFLKFRKLHIKYDSINMIKEIKSYKFIGKESKDNLPLKTNDHAMDALRYATTGLRQPKTYSSPMLIK